MFWKINYVIDNGYAWNKRVCIINADSEENALDIFYTEMNSKSKREDAVIKKYTKISECENNVILYDGSI